MGRTLGNGTTIVVDMTILNYVLTKLHMTTCTKKSLWILYHVKGTLHCTHSLSFSRHGCQVTDEH